MLERFRSARCLGDDVDALLLEQVAEPGAEEVVVVDEQHADGGVSVSFIEAMSFSAAPSDFGRRESTSGS